MPFKLDKDRAKQRLLPVSFRLPEELVVQLKKMSEKEKLSITEVVTQMIEQAIADYKRSRG